MKADVIAAHLDVSLSSLVQTACDGQHIPVPPLLFGDGDDDNNDDSSMFSIKNEYSDAHDGDDDSSDDKENHRHRHVRTVQTHHMKLRSRNQPRQHKHSDSIESHQNTHSSAGGPRAGLQFQSIKLVAAKEIVELRRHKRILSWSINVMKYLRERRVARLVLAKKVNRYHIQIGTDISLSRI